MLLAISFNFIVRESSPKLPKRGGPELEYRSTKADADSDTDARR